jgi:hypothetical protein
LKILFKFYSRKNIITQYEKNKLLNRNQKSITKELIFKIHFMPKSFSLLGGNSQILRGVHSKLPSSRTVKLQAFSLPVLTVARRATDKKGGWEYLSLARRAR